MLHEYFLTETVTNPAGSGGRIINILCWVLWLYLTCTMSPSSQDNLWQDSSSHLHFTLEKTEAQRRWLAQQLAGGETKSEHRPWLASKPDSSPLLPNEPGWWEPVRLSLLERSNQQNRTTSRLASTIFLACQPLGLQFPLLAFYLQW
jgi:hypothetical protein